MTNTEFVTLILSRLGKRQGSDYLGAMVVQEIQTFIEQLERTKEELPWFLEATDTRTMVAGQHYLDLPSDFLKEVEETEMIITDLDSGAKYPCVKRIPSVVQARIAGCSPSTPNCYAIQGNRWYFAPTPLKAFQFSIAYGRKSRYFLKNDEETTDWILEAKQAVSHTVQEIVAMEHLQDAEMSMKYSKVATTSWMQFKDYCNARKYTNMTISSGDDDES